MWGISNPLLMYCIWMSWICTSNRKPSKSNEGSVKVGVKERHAIIQKIVTQNYLGIILCSMVWILQVRLLSFHLKSFLNPTFR